MKIKLKETVQFARTRHVAGSVVDLQELAAARAKAARADEYEAREILEGLEETARELVDAKLAEEVTDETSESTSSALDDAQEFFKHLNAKEAVEHIGKVRSTNHLKKLAVVERARPDGGRKSVAEAFEKRAAELEAPAPAGDGNSGKTEPTGAEGNE